MIMQKTLDAYGEFIDNLGAFAPSDILDDRDLGEVHGPLSTNVELSGDAPVCIVGVIDHAIPFAHYLLTGATGHTRIAGVWIMDCPVVRRQDWIPFGQHLSGAEIDYLRGLDGGPVTRSDQELYRYLGLIDPAKRSGRRYMQQYSHGAAVTGTAAGFDPDDPRGKAHPVIGVCLPDWALAQTSGAVTPLLIQAATCYIIAEARELARHLSDRAGKAVRPTLVVNISLGVTAGARDGSSWVEQMQDALSEDPPEGLEQVHFVLATGNSRQDRVNAVMRAGQGIGWQILPDDRTISWVEIWSGLGPGSGQKPLQVRLTQPDGRSVTSRFTQVGHKAQVAVVRDRGREVARLILQPWAEGAKGKRQVLSVVVPPSFSTETDASAVPVGQWRVELVDTPTRDEACAVIVQRDDRLPGFPPAGRQTFLADPAYRPFLPDGRWPGPDPVPPTSMIRRDGTNNAYAWGDWQLRCGAALGPPGENPTRYSSYSSLLADGSAGDLVATGDRGDARRGVLAPGMTACALQIINGTSIAAPALTRWLAATQVQRQAAGQPPLRTRAEVIGAAQARRSGWGPPPRVDPRMPWDIDH